MTWIDEGIAPREGSKGDVPICAPTFDGQRAIPSPRVTDIYLELLQLTPHDKLLEIGTGSGYQTSRFAETGAEVHSIELEPFVDPSQIGGERVYLHAGDGFKGLPNQAPFSVIAATCGVTEIPKAWIEQLEDGGRLVAPVGRSSGQRLTLFRKREHELIPERIGAYVRFQMISMRPEPKAIKPQYKS